MAHAAGPAAVSYTHLDVYKRQKVFMGDTGSLFLGASVVALAMAYDMPYFIVIGGILFLIEGISVVLQVVFYKLTHGKRIFKMTPIHHHFELCGWSEVKIEMCIRDRIRNMQFWYCWIAPAMGKFTVV